MKIKKRKVKQDDPFLNKTFIGVKFLTEASEILYYTIKARFIAIVIFHSYIDKYELIPLVIASLNISSKLTEQNKSLRQIIITTTYFKSLYEGSTSLKIPNISYSSYVNFKEKAIETELEILLDNNFDIQIDDLFQMFFDKFKNLTDFEKRFYQLNTVLFHPQIVSYDCVDLINLIKNGDLFERTVNTFSEIKNNRIDLETFNCRKKKTIGDNSLFRKFLSEN